MLNINQRLADVAVTYPWAAEVFLRHRLDYCCGGQQTLEEACAKRGLDAQAIASEIEASAAPSHDEPRRWAEAPLDEICDHVVRHYHEPLRRVLPALVTVATTVEQKHASVPSCPRGLAAHLQAMHEALTEHMAKEEQVLFPLIRAGRGPQARMPVRIMMMEHEDHGRALARTRELTGDLVIPEEACAKWRGLYRALTRLEAELMQHVHLENNVLFLRALGG